MKGPLKVFISYSHNDSDRPLLEKLLKQIAPLKHNKLIEIWEDSLIAPSYEWNDEIMKQLNHADIVVMLVSSDYIASEFVNNEEVPLAMKRCEEGHCRIVPVLLRSCMHDVPPYARYEYLPKEPVNQRLLPVDQWDKTDKALEVVARRLHELCKIMTGEPNADEERERANGYGLNTDSGKQALREVAGKLAITEEMSSVHLVNCNRQEVRDRFAQGFDERKKRGDKNHYYFLSACPRQMPPSVGERMIYELLGELIEEKPDTVFRQTDESNNDRIIIEKLPVGYNLEESQKQFKRTCARLFKWGKDISIEEGISAGKMPLPNYKYAILPFHIHKSAWKPFVPDYFRWIMEQFDRRTCGPGVLFFFVMFHENLHRNPDRESEAIIRSVDELCESYFENRDPGCISKGHLYPLHPVSEEDVDMWLMDLGEMKMVRRSPVIEALVSQLPKDEKEQYRNEKTFNMDRVELFQEVVFEIYNK